MKAVVIDSFGGVDKLHLKEVPTPTPSDTEVLIQVYNAGVNPVDWKIREGAYKDAMPHGYPLILGWDCSGVVKSIGKNVHGYKPGDEVFAYCRKPLIQWGTYAEYVTIDAGVIANKPKNISFAEAAAIPLSSLTAWQSIFDFANLQKGQTILIHAGAGGVGNFAIQFARNIGAIVITTASETNHPYVRKLGAQYTIDYTKENFVERVREIIPSGVDVVFDTVGGKTTKESVAVIRPGGVLVTILDRNIQGLKVPPTIKTGFVMVHPDGKQLSAIAHLIKEGRVKSPQIKELPLKDVAVAHEESQNGHIRGKIVLRVYK